MASFSVRHSQIRTTSSNALRFLLNVKVSEQSWNHIVTNITLHRIVSVSNEAVNTNSMAGRLTFMQFANGTSRGPFRSHTLQLTPFRKSGRVFYNQFQRLAVRDENGNEIGEVPTSDIQNDTMYLCPVTIGSGASAVTLNLDFDTGSADLWGMVL